MMLGMSYIITVFSVSLLSLGGSRFLYMSYKIVSVYRERFFLSVMWLYVVDVL